MKLSLGLNYKSRNTASRASQHTLIHGTSRAWLRSRLVVRRAYLGTTSPSLTYPLLVTPSQVYDPRSLNVHTRSLLVLSNKSRIQKTRAKKRLAKERLAQELVAEKLRIKSLFMKDPFYQGSWSLFTKVHFLFFTRDARPLWSLTQLNLLSLFSKKLVHYRSPKSLDARHPKGSSPSNLTQLTLLSIKL